MRLGWGRPGSRMKNQGYSLSQCQFPVNPHLSLPSGSVHEGISLQIHACHFVLPVTRSYKLPATWFHLPKARLVPPNSFPGDMKLKRKSQIVVSGPMRLCFSVSLRGGRDWFRSVMHREENRSPKNALLMIDGETSKYSLLFP